MITQMEKIETAFNSIYKAMAELRKLYNDSETSISEMDNIYERASLLNNTDFLQSITE